MTDLKNLDLASGLYGEIPKEVLDAAYTIETWTKKQGWMKWCINGVADRALVEDLQYRIKLIREAIEGSI